MKLTLISNEPIWINPVIEDCFVINGDTTIVPSTMGTYLIVKETPEQVAIAFEKATEIKSKEEQDETQT